MATVDFAIEPLTVSDVEELEPLWNALREHHAAVAPEYGPPRDREASWALRRAAYADYLAKPGSFCRIARNSAGQAIGYALVRLHGAGPIWPTDRSGELETLSVLPEARSSGVGAALITAAREELARQGIDAMSIQVLHTNHDGLRFYARHGFDPVVVTVWGDTAVEDD